VLGIGLVYFTKLCGHIWILK